MKDKFESIREVKNIHEAQLNIPTKLYGREKAIGCMVDVFERACGGKGLLMLVPGYSGVGKTSLVQQLKSPIAQRNGFFCQGKFNQFQQGVPYFAIQQAMTDLLNQLLGEDEARRNEWKQKLLEVMGDLGQLLIDLSPKFEIFIGRQPNVAKISPLEARHRFIVFFKTILQVFCKPDHPLVLFIDDWQWADAASIELLRQIGLSDDLNYFLIIAAYRNNEINEKHPFAMALNVLRQLGSPITTQEVKPLGFDDVGQFVNDALKPLVENFAGLTKIIHDRTQGNPFFMHAFLKYIYDCGTLRYDSVENIWRWNVDQADMEKFPEDVVEVFTNRFRQYDHKKQKLLFQAASLGNEFELSQLCMVSGYDLETCLNLLSSEIRKQFLIALTGESKTIDNGQMPTYLRFVHDRVQQAAYNLIPEESQPAEQLAIGRVLLKNLDLDQANLSDHLFEITRHMNAGKHLLNDPEERIHLLELNVRTARKAKLATAFKAALDFHREAGALLEDAATAENAWEIHHDLTMALYLEWAETEFLEGDKDKSERHAQTALDKARTPLEKAEAQRVLIVQYTLQARYPEAIAAGRGGLEALGISLPEADYKVMRNIGIKQVRANIKGKQVGSFFDMPIMSNPEMSKATQLLITLGPPCYRSHQQLWSVLVTTVVNIILQYGNMPEVGYSHTALAGLLIWAENDFALAREFTDLSVNLMTQKFEAPADRSVFYLMIGSSARHWFFHMNRSSQDYADAYEVGSRFGNLQYAAYAFGHDMYCRFFQGTPLQELRKETENSLNFSRTRYNQWAIDLLEGGCHIIDELTGEDAEHKSDPNWEEKYFQAVDEHHNIQVACIYKVIRSFELYIMGKFEQAIRFSDQANAIIYTVGLQGLLPWPEHLLIRFMIHASMYEKQDDDTRALWDEEMNSTLERFKVWAKHCPSNYEFKYYLAQAELARLHERNEESIVFYERAISATQEGSFLQWQGVASERIARLWESHGLDLHAVIYWQQAYNCYDIWGSYIKTASIEQNFQERMLRFFPKSTEGEYNNLLENIRNTMVVRQVELLRSREKQSEEISKRRDAERQSHELTQATARLREEVARRKEIEERLKEKEASLVEAQRLAKVGSWKFDLQTGEIWGSDQGFQIYGLEPPASKLLPIKKIEACIPEKERVNQALMDLINKEKPYDIEFEIFPADGSAPKIIISKANLIRDNKGNPTQVTGVIQDITERKNMERQLAYAHKLESIGQLAAGVAHEINTPIMYVFGNIHFLKNSMDSITQLLEKYNTIYQLVKDKKDATSFLPVVEKAIKDAELNFLLEEIPKAIIDSEKGLDRVAHIVKAMKKFSHPDMDEMKMIDVNDAVENTITIAYNEWRYDSVIVRNFAKDLPLLQFTPGDFNQVILNLLVNAAHANSEMIRKAGGKGTISISTISDGESLKISIKDTGVGIPLENQHKIFDQFFTTKEVGKGTGQGLSITHSIVKKHGGTITFNTETNKGTTFVLYFPLKQKDLDGI
ncbi:AAA family ATPase [Desulfovibrio gilichinskyi]|uniref:histidine kinase n=1 Tax=Desulfovibrio gilichinskyi TaxID=1519643 RepID=A0A1X7CEM2_9BACT|nr:AAA family ATPase [Desulfovibrio gilichinskyi]SME95248.1 PAS domain S-box-containing protein [Desulfovibrio gilichinskyi]